MMTEHSTNNSFPLIEIRYKRGSSELTYLNLNNNNNTMGIHSQQKEDFPLKHCDHEMAFRRSMKNDASRRAERTLILVSLLTVIFIAAELVGGLLAHSLAIMTDAFHMISDLGSFMISIMAIHLARKNPTARYSFGFQRAEILGALTSIIIIWILTAILIYMAIMRIINRDIEVDADVMMITSGIGVFFNLVMGGVLYFGKAEHSHFGMSHSHGAHGHSHGHSGSHGHSHGASTKSNHSHNDDVEEGKIANIGNHLAVPLPTAADHSHDHHPQEQGNLNIRAAFIHVLGDLVQSIGVLIAAIIIKFSGFSLADPICTFVFAVLVLLTTIGVLKDTIHVLMEATPSHISLSKVCSDLMSIEGVGGVHSLRIWSLKLDSTAISVHLDTNPGADVSSIVRDAQQKLQHGHGIDFITVQAQCSLSRAPSELQLLAVNS